MIFLPLFIRRVDLISDNSEVLRVLSWRSKSLAIDLSWYKSGIEWWLRSPPPRISNKWKQFPERPWCKQRSVWERCTRPAGRVTSCGSESWINTGLADVTASGTHTHTQHFLQPQIRMLQLETKLSIVGSTQRSSGRSTATSRIVRYAGFGFVSRCTRGLHKGNGVSFRLLHFTVVYEVNKKCFSVSMIGKA